MEKLHSLYLKLRIREANNYYWIDFWITHYKLVRVHIDRERNVSPLSSTFLFGQPRLRCVLILHIPIYPISYVLHLKQICYQITEIGHSE